LRAETIERAIGELMMVYPRKDSLFGVTKWQARFYGADGRPVNHDPARLERTQDLAPMYEENSNLYIFRGEQLRQRKNRIGERPILFEIDRMESVDIDDEAGWRLAEALHGVVAGRVV
jgi:CMP-N-acetylneuraminic acid synthetase